MPLAVLSIDLEAKLAKLEDGFDKAGRLAEKQAHQIERAFGGLRVAAASLGGLLGGVFAVKEMAAFFQATVDGLDKLNDLRDATGASIENISALEDVALRTGSSFDTVSSALVKLNSFLKETKPGSQQAEILKQIGLSAEELKRLDPAEALLKVATALSAFADDGNKARIVSELLGKSVAEVAPLLKDLAEKGRLIATVTTEQAEAAEKFNQQLAALSKSGLDLARDLTGPLVSAMNQTIDQFKQGAKEGKGFFQVLREGQLKALGFGNVDSLRQSLFGLNQAIRNIEAQGPLDFLDKAQLDGMRQKAAELRKEIEKLEPSGQGRRPANEGGGGFLGISVGDVPDKPDKAKKPKDQKRDFVGPELPESTKQALDALKGIELEQSKRATAAIQDLNAMFVAGGIGAEQFGQALEKLRGKEIVGPLLPPEELERIKRLNELLAATPTSQLAAAREEMLLLAAALERGDINAKQFTEAAQTRLGTLPENFKKLTDDMTVFAEQAARNIQDALGDTIFDVLDGKFENIGQQWANLLKRMYAEALAAKIGKALVGDLGATGQGGGGGGEIDLMKMLAGLFSFGGGRAGGGGVQAGKFYEVNEEGGPGELLEVDGRQYLMAARNGHVRPNRRGAASGAGGGSVINFNPTIYVDGATDPARLAQITAQGVQAGIEQFSEQLKAQGVL